MTLKSSFKKLGFTCLLADQCVYVQRSDEGIIITVVHVDDMSIFTSNDKLITEIESKLATQFPINKLGEL